MNPNLQKRRAEIEQSIRDAFPAVRPLVPFRITDSVEGDEPYRLIDEFQNKTDWTALSSEFIDRAPKGLGSALSFFSDEAICFYLPAYLIAALDNKLQQADVVFCLTHGLECRSRDRLINPIRYADETWWDYATRRWSRLTTDQVRAVVAFLEFERARDEWKISDTEITEALESYWYRRL